MREAAEASGGRPERPRARAGWVAAGLVALALVFYVFPLALHSPLVDPDEGLHAAIAQEIVERGDWVMPRVLGVPFLDKPILFFWAEAASLRLVGMTETGVRLPGLLFGLLGALTTAWLAGGLAGRRTAVLSGALYATMLLPLALNQAAVHDVALVPWTNLAMLFLWRAHQRPTRGRVMAEALVAGLFLGLAMLTKGLVGVALVGVPFGIALILERRLTVTICIAGVLALAVGAALAAPWYAAMERVQPGYLHYFFVERHLLGFATGTQIHGDRPWWYYLPILIGGGLPWVLYLPFATRRESSSRWRAGTRVAWVWIVGGVVLLSVAGSKLVTYVLPLFPAVAILAAVVWDAWLDGQGAGARVGEGERGRTAALMTHGLVGVALVPVAAIIARERFGIGPSGVVGVGQGLMLLASIMAIIAWRSGGRRRTLTWWVASMAIMFVTIMAGYFPTVAEQMSARDLSRYLNARGSLPAQVMVVDERVGSVIFYLDPALRRGLAPGRIAGMAYGAMLARLSSAPADDLVAISALDAPKLARALGPGDTPFDRAGRYCLYTVGALRERLLGRRSG